MAIPVGERVGMTSLFVAARAFHYGSALLLFGELLALVWIAGTPGRSTSRSDASASRRRFSSVAGGCVVVSLASGLAWFVLEAAVMSGLPLGSALHSDTLALVLDATAFGRLWLLRAALLAILCALLVATGRGSVDAHRSIPAMAATLVAATYLGTLAWAGHAAAGQGSDDDLEIVADLVHLLAAGAWLGALPALVFLLGDAGPEDLAADAARRFSMLGLACVAALIGSGLVNAWYQVGSVPALVGTEYGRWLLAKVSVFALMLAVATVNRGYLVPRMATGDRGARRSLRLNAMLEAALGIFIVFVVGRLGVTEPAAHQPAVWPFARTLSWQAMERSAWTQLVLAAAGAIALAAALFALKGALSRPPRLSWGAFACIAVPAALFAWLLAVPAHPTTYLTSPVGYTTRAVADGAARYSAYCSACHGRDGRGERSAARSPPVELTERVPQRREGDLFWSIAHGIPGTAMPEFAPPLTDDEIWNLIQFLDAQWAARNATAMTDRVKPLLPIAAPDFTFEFPGRPQESLRAVRDKRVTLLVFYTVPQSLPRLDELEAKHRAYAAAGARVIAVPMDGSPIATVAATVPAGTPILARVGGDVSKAYALFAPPEGAPDERAPAHLEYLIDRDLYLRVRRVGVPAADAARTTDMLNQIDILFGEPPRAPPQWGHRH